MKVSYISTCIAVFLCIWSMPVSAQAQSAQSEACKALLQKHLNAVSQRDFEALKTTMAPSGKMQLILPGTEIIYSVQAFLDYHEEWFKDTTWTFETEILHMDVGEKMAAGTTQIVYREPLRDGKPYFNRMIVTYVLEKINGKWYVISDHASSVEKSTDQ